MNTPIFNPIKKYKPKSSAEYFKKKEAQYLTSLAFMEPSKQKQWESTHRLVKAYNCNKKLKTVWLDKEWLLGIEKHTDYSMLLEVIQFVYRKEEQLTPDELKHIVVNELLDLYNSSIEA